MLNEGILYEQAHRLVKEAESRLASEDKEAAAEALRQIADYIYGDIPNVGCKVSEAAHPWAPAWATMMLSSLYKGALEGHTRDAQ